MISTNQRTLYFIGFGKTSQMLSDDDGFLVFAEDAAEGVGDFAYGGVGFDGSEDGGEKIFGADGAAAEFDKSGLRFGGIALRAQGV